MSNASSPGSPKLPDFLAIATEVIKVWKDNPLFKSSGATAPDVVKIAKLVLGLAGPTGVDLSNVATAASTVIALLSKIQKHSGVDDGEHGILGPKTLSILPNIRRCTHPERTPPKLAPTSLARKFNAVPLGNSDVIFYFVEPSLSERSIGGFTGKQLIRTAWAAWQDVAEITLRDVEASGKSREDANVVLEERSIDGENQTLGIADVGGRRFDSQLVLTMDKDESWTEVKFVAAVTHELGHILGLRHSDTPNQLMNPFLNLEGNIVTPQEEDKRRLIQEAQWSPAIPAKPATVEEGPVDFPGLAKINEFLKNRPKLFG